MDKNHQRRIRELIDEQTTDEGGAEKGVTYKWIGDLVFVTVTPNFSVYTKMTHKIVLISLLLAQATASIVELNCSDNATCIDNMAKELMRSMRERRTVKLFDVLTVEPVAVRQARASQGLLSRFLQSHAFSFDWDNWTFRLTKPQDRSDVLDLVIYESRTAKDDSEASPKKSNSKVEEDDDKRPKRLKRRHKKKVLQAVVPLVFGMKSAATAIFALALVAALTIKAFIASKLALVVTVGMALKKLYETYSSGVGLQNHPYLYSQYPIDFPSASSHAYSVSGVSPQFASPEMYNPTALATHSHTHEMLQQNDASAQQSQQAPMLQLVNNTRASERWDGYQKRPMHYGPSRATSESYSAYHQEYHH